MAVGILLIDDNADQVVITKQALKDCQDYRIETAMNGQDGVKKALAQDYDVILCDYRLPPMSGMDVLKQLKQHQADVPFIMVTGVGNERIAVEALQSGAYDYIVKDATYEEILPGIIHRALDRHREKQERQRLEAERDQAQAALQTSYEQLKGLVGFKDEFLSKVSHELRTPLTSIQEGVALLMEQALGTVTPEQRDYLAVMDRDIKRLIELVNNMLDVSKSEAGQMQLQHRQVELRQLIDMAIQSFRPVRGNRTISVEGPQQVLAFVDPHRMLQVFSNLLSNAIKFTADEGTIVFHIACNDQQLAVSVRDNGRGISAQDLPKLFLKFSQVGPRDPNQPRGTGLGLVLCKELVELHQGRIDVASQPNQGTTFTVLLPIHTASVILTESFRELQVLAVFEKQKTIGVIAIQVGEPLVGDVAGERLKRQPLMEDVRRIVHRNDIVLDMEPSWIVVLAVTDPHGIPTIVRRLREALKCPQRLQFGSAVYPTDGTDATTLFECVKRALDRDLAAPH